MATLAQRIDQSEARARLVATVGFRRAAERQVRLMGRLWIAANPEPGELSVPVLALDTWREQAERAVTVAARGWALGSALERLVPPLPETPVLASAIPLRPDELASAEEIMAAVIRPQIEGAAAGLGESMVDALSRLTLQAAERGWSVERYRGAVNRALLRMGAGGQGFPVSWAASWYRTLLTSSWAQGLQSRMEQEPTSRLWPYMEYVPLSDGRVRPNHAHLRGFVAATGWSGWARVRPANGYNCRCKMRPIGWPEARRRRLTGDLPGRSSSILASWSGPDPGFAKAA